ncbi:MAG: hypothetical protein M0002_07965, partial [Rhodospirillales bacterium]|nr:hypothetical protein [Rhodospirillales bacterium]
RPPEGSTIPSNTLDEMRRDMARLAVVRGQIEAIEQARLERLETGLGSPPDTDQRPRASDRGTPAGLIPPAYQGCNQPD